MAKYILLRILRSLLSAVVVVAVVMALVYGCLDRELIFAADPNFNHVKGNARQVYKLQQWERYGYVDYVPYTDFLRQAVTGGAMTAEAFDASATLGRTAAQDSPATAAAVEAFTAEYTARGYTVTRLDGKLRAGTQKYQDGGEPRLYAYRDVPLAKRLLSYFAGLIQVDTTAYVKEPLPQRGLTFTLRDPVYGGKRFSPAVLGSGTYHKYLLYCDSRFPFVHQNAIKLRLGSSYSVNQGVDVFDTMTRPQGALRKTVITYPTGLTEESADDLHTVVYAAGSLEKGGEVLQSRFTDDYTALSVNRAGKSKLGYSFTIGLLAVILSYAIAVPLGVFMALHKGRLADRLGTGYIVFITAVPSLAYIFLFKAIGGALGLPTTFDMESPTASMYVLPVASLALPAASSLMKWLRRYMVDQLHADYVKFARAGGLSEGEIFTKHILRNAIIPLVHGIPASVLGALVGAIITERVYVVPGAGNLLSRAINSYDNGVIVGVTLFYAVLSAASVILGDLLLGAVDPRISFVRGNGHG